MLTIRYRWKGKCPKHVRYDPAKTGEGGIKGACPTCSLLFEVFKAHRATIGQATIFDEVQRAGQPRLGDHPLSKRIRVTNALLRAGRSEGESLVEISNQARKRLRCAQ
ncbi:MAG TPA: hypothetical protein VGR34_06410 [Candidatus Dormibacteraeota bacterium]|nr:hypothetical protein [Candidatus Dormibacteraeota bacterium]